MMKYHTMGINIRHEGAFCIDRPHGSADNLLVVFKTPAKITINNNEIIVPPDSAILYSKGEKQLYSTCGELYVNHFLHMDCDEYGEFCKTSEIPFNKPVLLNDVEAVTDVLKAISCEIVSTSANKEKYIDLLIKMLLLRITDDSRSVSKPHEKTVTAGN